MAKKYCVDCERKREPYKPVLRDNRHDGVIYWVCRQCWQKFGYDEFMPETAGAYEVSPR